MRNVETTRALSIAGLLLASASSAHAGMEVAFDDANVLRHIRSGEATFATGGGELWTAEFSAGSNREERLTVSPSMATSRSYRESDTEIVLAWRDLPLGTESLPLAVAKAADPLGHRHGKDIVGGEQDLVIGAEIVGKQDLSRLSLSRRRIICKVPVLFQE